MPKGAITLRLQKKTTTLHLLPNGPGYLPDLPSILVYRKGDSQTSDPCSRLPRWAGILVLPAAGHPERRSETTFPDPTFLFWQTAVLWCPPGKRGPWTVLDFALPSLRRYNGSTQTLSEERQNMAPQMSPSVEEERSHCQTPSPISDGTVGVFHIGIK